MQVFQGIELRPYARQGKAYFTELREILHKEGTAIYQDAQDFMQREDGKITVRLVGALAIKH